MDKLKVLFELQEREEESRILVEKISSSPVRKEFTRSRAYVKELNNTILELESELKVDRKQLKVLEFENTDQAEKIRGLEERLYDGSVQNSKELNQMEQSLAVQKSENSEVENKLLNLMETVNEKEERLVKLKDEYRKVLTELKELQVKGNKEISQLQKKLEKARKKKAALSKKAGKEYLGLYNRLKKRNQRPVSLVTENVCSECNIFLSSIMASGLKNSNELNYCECCGRVLYYKPKEPEIVPE